MWKGYASSGVGYSLGFSPKKLNAYAQLVQVRDGEQAFLDAAQQIIGWQQGALKQIDWSDQDAGLYEARDIDSAAFVALILLAHATKDEGFAYEEEWRFVETVDYEDRVDVNKVFLTVAGNLQRPRIVLDLPVTPEGSL